MIVTTNGKKYIKKDCDVTIRPRTRYFCYKKSRHKQCNGQTGYTVKSTILKHIEIDLAITCEDLGLELDFYSDTKAFDKKAS